MARWRPEKGWESEKAFPKRGRRWGRLMFYKSPKWGWIVKTTPEVPESAKRAIRGWTEWLKLMNILYKNTSPEVLIELKRQEKISGIPARDLFSSAMNGLLYVIVTEDGREIYSMAHVERISKSLDVFSRTRGALLVRGDEVWEGLASGSVGEVLRIGPDGRPGWGQLAVAGGGGPWTSLGLFNPDPPGVDTFPTRVGFENETYRAHSSGIGVLFARLSGTGGRGWIWRLREVSIPVSITVGFSSLSRRTGDRDAVVVLYHSPSGRGIVAGDFRDGFQVARWNSYTSYHSVPYRDTNTRHRDWLVTVKLTSSGYQVYYRPDASLEVLLFQEGWGFFGGPATQVGIGTIYWGIEGVGWFWHYQEVAGGG
jgi:hypothetical protein